MRNLIVMFSLPLASSPAFAADAKKELSEAQKAPQQRMTDCSKGRWQKGDDRKVLMKDCLEGNEALASPLSRTR